MNHLDQSMKAQLSGLLHGRVCIVGVGNRGRGDDGAGPRVIDALCEGTRGVWVDAGMALENYLEPIVRSSPDTVLIVDAVAFGEVPGECRLMDFAAMDTLVLSTHAGSLGMLSKYLSTRTGARLRVIGIQPETIDASDGLSQSVDEAVGELTSMLSDLLGPVALRIEESVESEATN